MTTIACLITIDSDDPALTLPCATEAQAQARKRAVAMACLTHVVEVMSERDAAMVCRVLDLLREDGAATGRVY